MKLKFYLELERGLLNPESCCLKSQGPKKRNLSLQRNNNTDFLTMEVHNSCNYCPQLS